MHISTRCAASLLQPVNRQTAVTSSIKQKETGKQHTLVKRQYYKSKQNKQPKKNPASIIYLKSTSQILAGSCTQPCTAHPTHAKLIPRHGTAGMLQEMRTYQCGYRFVSSRPIHRNVSWPSRNTCVAMALFQHSGNLLFGQPNLDGSICQVRVKTNGLGNSLEGIKEVFLLN